MPPRRIERIDERLGISQKRNFIRRSISIINETVRLMSTDQNTQYCITRIENLRRDINRTTGILLSAQVARDLDRDLQQLLDKLSAENQVEELSGYQSQRNLLTNGAPRYHISEEQLRFLVRVNFGIPQIANILNVSTRTVKRRLRMYGISLRALFTRISDNDLDQAVRHVIRQNSKIGPNSVQARLFAQGKKVQRWRVRESLHRVDPGGVAMRSVNSTHRRRYTVAGPNSLWHADGNLKLIRWKIAIHACIDGYSRLLTFMKASNRNSRDVVTRNFVVAASQYGIPSRIRVDHGKENDDICSIMELLRGPGRSSALRGTSCHNQRIERNWRDMWNGVTNLYYDAFHFLEEREYLDVDNPNHIWALHYIYLPRVNRDLELFRNQWNNHGLRTEHHQTPLQMFVGGSLQLSNHGLSGLQDLFQTRVQHVDQNVDQAVNDILSTSDLQEPSGTEIPGIPCPLSSDSLENLKETIDPLDDSMDELGFELFRHVIDFIDHQ